MRRQTLCSAVVLALGTTACLPHEPMRPTPTPVHATLRGAVASGAAPDSAWWRAYGSPSLDSLVTLALAESPDLAAAAARLAEADASRRAAGGKALPTVDASASVTRSRQVLGNIPAFELSLQTLSQSASWEIDLFGRLQAERKGAAARLVAAGYDLADAQRTIVARVVRRYLDAVSLAERATLADSALAARRLTAALVRERERTGLTSGLEVEQAEAAIADAAAQRPLLEADRVDALGDLAVLTGRDVATIEGLLAAARPIAGVPPRPLAVVPAEIVRRRPDVRAAEARVRVAVADVQQGKAALLPSLSLTGTIGQARVGSASPTGTWSFGPSLSLPFLNGAARGELAVRRAVVQQREAEWRSAVVSAVRDVETALERSARELERAERLDEVATRRSAVERLALARWRAGQSDFRDVLDAQRSALDVADAISRQRAAAGQAVATLWQALGGA